MTRLRTISGVGGKAAACFLVETAGQRLLLDLGREPGTGRPPDLDGLGQVDAVLLSHGHDDHVGALDLIDRIGRPPVYATPAVAQHLPGGLDVRPLSLQGAQEVAGLPLATGRNGHAPGGVWLHLATADGDLLYAGDLCLESQLYAVDPIPPARLVVLDASYGADDAPQTERRDHLVQLMSGGRAVLLPAPPRGRGPELALLAQDVTGEVPAICPATRAAVQDLLGVAAGSVRDEALPGLEALAEAPDLPDEPAGIMVAGNADASGGAAATLTRRWRDRPDPLLVFTGHVPDETPAAGLLAEGRALWRRWNVHPRRSDNQALVRSAGASVVLAAFTRAWQDPELAAAFSPARLAAGPLVAF